MKSTANILHKLLMEQMNLNWRYAGIEYDDVANGIGLGAVFFTQGCPHQCPECQNPQTWSRDGGEQFTDAVLDQLLQYYFDIPYASRLTLSGGDPLASSELTYRIIFKFKTIFPHKKVWLYTGYRFEDFAFNIPETETEKLIQKIVRLCDVIVDGEFEIDKRDITLQFMGSSNQRIIDAKKSMQNNQIILWKENRNDS